MDGMYDDVVEEAKNLFVKAILERERNLADRALLIDGDVNVLLRKLGLESVESILAEVANEECAKEVASGLTVQHRKPTPFLPSSEK